MGIIYEKSIFSKDDDDIIRQYYSIEGGNVYKRLDDKTKKQCISRANILGISCERNNRKWTNNEKNILKKYYQNEKGIVYKRLNGRSKVSCMNQAKKLGLTKSINRKWTKEEIDILKKYYPIEGIKVASRLQSRTKETIKNKVYILGISKKKRIKYVYKRGNKYYVEFTVEGKVKTFGTFKNEDEAAKVAMEKAKEYGKAI